MLHDETDGTAGTIESEGVLAKPYMVLFQAIQGDGDGAQALLAQFVESLAGQCQAVGHHAPGVSAFFECATDIRQVLAHEGFASGDDDQDLMGVHMGCYLRINDTEEVFCGHVGLLHGRDAVAAAMETVDITAQGAFPKQLPERMELLEVASAPMLQP